MTKPMAGVRYLTCREVGTLMRVDPKTVSRWALAGRLRGAYRTPGRKRRGPWRIPETALTDLEGPP